eukprot:COSAG02_NODE_72862_length_180_cov_23.469136_1_plen_34_part_01
MGGGVGGAVGTIAGTVSLPGNPTPSGGQGKHAYG